MADYLISDIDDDYRIPTSCKAITEGHTYPNFGHERNAAVFWTGTTIVQLQWSTWGWVGGAWDSTTHFKNDKHLYDSDHIASEEDTPLPFVIPDLLCNIPGKQRTHCLTFWVI